MIDVELNSGPGHRKSTRNTKNGRQIAAMHDGQKMWERDSNDRRSGAAAAWPALKNNNSMRTDLETY